MFRFFENLVNPYCEYPERDVPPDQLWPFLLEYSRPFRAVFWWTAVISVLAAVIEVSLIFYMGRVIDLLANNTPQQLINDYATELVLAALFILFLRPLIEALGTGLLNNTSNWGNLAGIFAIRFKWAHLTNSSSCPS